MITIAIIVGAVALIAILQEAYETGYGQGYIAYETGYGQGYMDGVADREKKNGRDRKESDKQNTTTIN